jgi:hypothetical protein
LQNRHRGPFWALPSRQAVYDSVRVIKEPSNDKMKRKEKCTNADKLLN